jgi:hypothetical protein
MVGTKYLQNSWSFLRSNTSEQLEFNLEKIIGSYKHAGKVRKDDFMYDSKPVFFERLFTCLFLFFQRSILTKVLVTV